MLPRGAFVLAALVAGIVIGMRLRPDAAASREESAHDAGSVVVDNSTEPARIQPAARTPGIGGHIHLPEGWSRESVRVRAGLASRFSAPRRFRALSHRRTASRHDRYAFEFHDLSHGSYVVAASIDGKYADVHTAVEVRDMMVTCDLVIESVARPGYLPIQVLGPEGQGAPDLQFEVRTEAPTQRPRAFRRSDVDVNGVLHAGAMQPGKVEFFLGVESGHTCDQTWKRTVTVPTVQVVTLP